MNSMVKNSIIWSILNIPGKNNREHLKSFEYQEFYIVLLGALSNIFLKYHILPFMFLVYCAYSEIWNNSDLHN